MGWRDHKDGMLTVPFHEDNIPCGKVNIIKKVKCYVKQCKGKILNILQQRGVLWNVHCAIKN